MATTRVRAAMVTESIDLDVGFDSAAVVVHSRRQPLSRRQRKERALESQSPLVISVNEVSRV